MVPYDLESQFVGNISRYLQFDLLPDGKASVIWMLGEYGEVEIHGNTAITHISIRQ